ncbi:transporter substrate-binding domain-containing protein [Pseudomaricurvus alkylphenolicus]|uniref:substrate-binding periplasmic protein n=1 Tax=Pseudomaricurvus alkylphenolicus TaxID=1306991 RepID=UPI00141EB65C|nr:transporter substrate-binding domain-containing protein [Pseudomaricurvus alkylphenolicus]NIB45073.1 transporter substrate-binding domain-containing protein [Pseudomaricurvus alkylphenolicus]
MRLLIQLSIPILSVLLLCAPLSTVAAKGTVTIGFDHWPPYSFKNAPEQGIIFPLIQKALSHSGYQAIPHFYPPKRLLPQLLQNKEIDTVCGVWRTAEREAFLLFSLPILTNHLSFYAVAGHSHPFVELSDLQGYRIGLIRGYEYNEGTKKTQLQSLKVTLVTSAAELFKMLAAGRIDLALSDQRVADWASEKIMSATSFETVGNVFLSKDLHCVTSKNHPRAQELIDAINAGLREGDIAPITR